MIIFSYIGSPQVKISQKVLGGLLFSDSHCISAHVRPYQPNPYQPQVGNKECLLVKDMYFYTAAQVYNFKINW